MLSKIAPSAASLTLEDIGVSGMRVLEIGARSPALARALAEAGATRYLGLVAGGTPSSWGAVDPTTEGRFHPLLTPEQARYNDTDLLVLRAPFTRGTWAVRDLRHVTHLAVECASPAAWLELHGATTLTRLTGSVDHLGTSVWGGSRFAVFRVEPDRRPRPRHYLSEAVGVTGLLRRLHREGLDYVVLRWFEGLPRMEPGEDLDLLVADRHLHRLQEILAEEPGTIPVDVYSETGLEGADHRGMAYYPPPLATGILERARTHHSGARVPDGEDHLYSLAYHAAYHKGADSGLRSSLVTGPGATDHDYAAALTEAARPLGRSFPVTLEEVDEELAAQGWRPPLDTLRRLAPSNPWVGARFFADGGEHPGVLPEPAVFFIRERTVDVLGRDDALGVIESFGFEVLAVRDLAGEALARTTGLVRGGNWGRGPFRVSGGGPAVVVVAAHYGPRRPNAALRARYPHLTNGDVLHAKLVMRDLVETRVGTDRSFNPVHSADDELETWDYVEIALPEELAALREQVQRRRDDYRTQVPVLEVLSHGRRAKVEVVEGVDGRPVVRKTFAPHGLAHMEREMTAMRSLAPHVDAVPPVLRRGPTWFETEFVHNSLATLPDRPDGRLVPLGLARRMVEVLREVHAHGFDLVDAKPQNFLVGADGRLRLVDFEFSHRYPGPPPAFEDIYSFVGPPVDFAGDLPYGELSYEARWLPFVGLPRESLLHDPAWRQHLHRTLHRTTALVRTTTRRARSAVRRSAVLRARAGSRHRHWARTRSGIVR